MITIDEYEELVFNGEWANTFFKRFLRLFMMFCFPFVAVTFLIICIIIFICALISSPLRYLFIGEWLD